MPPNLLSPTTPDARVAAIAAWQHASITWDQLRRCGLSAAAIAWRVRAGWLRRVHKGVYVVAAHAWSWLTRAHAGVLACGPGACLSHRSAASLYGLLPEPTSARVPVEITVPRGSAHPQTGIRLHRPRTLTGADVTQRQGIAVVEPGRLALDLATRLGAKDLDRTVNHARTRQTMRPAELREAVARHPRHRGAKAVAALLAGPFTRSELERALTELLAEAGLADGARNVLINGDEADAFWASAALVVELDGAATHMTPMRIAADAAKQSRFEARGLTVRRLTWWDVVRDARRTAVHLRRLGVPPV